MEIENLNKFLLDQKIDLSTFEKVMYSILKHLIHKNNKSADLYEPNVDMLNSKLEIRNLQSNNIVDLKADKLEGEKIIGQRYILDIRNYLFILVTNIQSLKIDIDKVYELAKTNNNVELQTMLDSLVSYHKEKLNNIVKEIDELDAELTPRKKRSNFSNENSRYCPACQESPCMCSDPDPG